LSEIRNYLSIGLSQFWHLFDESSSTKNVGRGDNYYRLH